MDKYTRSLIENKEIIISVRLFIEYQFIIIFVHNHFIILFVEKCLVVRYPDPNNA